MLVTTEALVLSKTNYSETSLIVRCYTQTDGIKSYMIKGGKQGRNGKKKHCPLSATPSARNHCPPQEQFWAFNSKVNQAE